MRRTIIVSDRTDWAARVVEVARELDLVPSMVEWTEAPALTERSNLLVLDIDRNLGERREFLERWASRALQPICIVSVTSGPGSATFFATAQQLGYAHVMYCKRGRRYWERLRAAMRRIVSSSVWLVAQLARTLKCEDPAVVRALTIGLLMLPRRSTVTSWADELGTHRQGLAKKFSREGVPPPHDLLTWVRLLRVVERAERADDALTRDELAREVAYASGDYLGRVAKQLTGIALGELIEVGVEGTLNILSSRA